MNNKEHDYRIKIIILLLATIASIVYLISLKLAYPIFQSTRLVDPLAELHSLFPLHYIALGIIALLGAACFIFRISNRGIHILILLLMAIMLWYTPHYHFLVESRQKRICHGGLGEPTFLHSVISLFHEVFVRRKPNLPSQMLQ